MSCHTALVCSMHATTTNSAQLKYFYRPHYNLFI